MGTSGFDFGQFLRRNKIRYRRGIKQKMVEMKSSIIRAFKKTKALTLKQLYRKCKKQIKKLINKILLREQKDIMRKRILNISLIKHGLDQVLKLKAEPEIEDYFRRAAQKQNESEFTEVSNKWKDAEGNGLTFYIKNEKLSNKVSGFTPIMDNFGNGLMDNGNRINLALLRIKGISEGDGVSIKTDDLLGHEETKQYIEMLGSWTKGFYEENLRDQEITASITFEV